MKYTLVLKNSKELRQRAKPVAFPIDDSVHNCIEECINTLRRVEGFHAGKGLSLSAPQVGFDMRLFVVTNPSNWNNPRRKYRQFTTLINPQIVTTSEESIALWESCLSFPDYIALVERPKEVLFRFYDVKGNELKIRAEGAVARILQHEMDHLEGVLMEDVAKDFMPVRNIDTKEKFLRFYRANKEQILL